MRSHVAAGAAIAMLFGLGCGRLDRQYEDRSVADSSRRDDAGEATGSVADASLDLGRVPSSALQGARCYESEQGQRACAGAAQRDVLLCDDGEWRLHRVCERDENCDQSRSACARVTEVCADRQPGQSFCNGDVLTTCGEDLTTSLEEECEGRCVGSAKEGFSCAAPRCGDGKVGEGEECDDDSNGCVECQTVEPVATDLDPSPRDASSDEGPRDSDGAAGEGSGPTDDDTWTLPDASVIRDEGVVDAGPGDAGGGDAGDAQVASPLPLGDACESDLDCASVHCEATTLASEVCCAVECPAGLGCSTDGSTCVECELAASYCSGAEQLSECSGNQWSVSTCPVGCEESAGSAQCAPLITLGGSCTDSAQCETGTECVDGLCCETDCAGGQVCDPGGECECPQGQEVIDGVCKLPIGASCSVDGPACDGVCETTESGDWICCQRSCATGEVCHSTTFGCVDCETEPATPTCNGGGDIEQCIGNGLVATSCDGAGCFDGECRSPDGASCSEDPECISGNCADSAGNLRCCAASDCDLGCDATGSCFVAQGGSCESGQPCASGTECIDGMCCEQGCAGGQVCGSDGACTCPSGQVWSGGLCKLPEGSACTNGGTPCEGSCEPTEAGNLVCCEQVCGADEVCHSTDYSCVECEAQPSSPICQTTEGVAAVVQCVNHSLNITPCPDGCSAGECLGADGDTCSVNAECGSSNCVSGQGTKRCCPASNCGLGCNASGTCYECSGTAKGCSGGHVAVCSSGFWAVTQTCSLGCYANGASTKCKLGSGSICTVNGECASGECDEVSASGTTWLACD